MRMRLSRQEKTQYVNNQNGMQAKGPPDMIGMEAPLELPIFIYYRPSMRVAVFNTLVHIGAIFCLFLADIPATVMGLIGACVLIHYGFYIKRFLSPENICFKLDKHDQWQLLRDNDEAGDLRLLPGPLVHPQLVVLRFKDTTGRTYSCVLAHDNLDKQTLRRLRVRLRWQH